jgi:hypothetical protein
MRKPFLFCSLALVALAAVALNGCNKRFNGIDNDDALKIPYSVYFSDTMGALYNTNDGEVIKRLVFPSDGYPSRAFAITGANHMVWVKANAHYSNNSGDNFNPTYLKVNPFSYNQSALLYARDQERVYITSTEGFGVSYNEKNGEQEQWQMDSQWDETIVGPISVTSLAQQTNGVINGYDAINTRMFVKENKGDKWSEVNMDTSGTFKPHHGSMTIFAFKTTVVAIDATDSMGAWYSTNNGQNWTQYTGIPAHTKLAIAGAPFNEEVFIGTYYMGLYRLQAGQMVSSNEGLDPNTIVRGIKGKIERYKNDSEKRVVYLTTNTGVYRSLDIGRNWVKIKEGNFINVY